MAHLETNKTWIYAFGSTVKTNQLSDDYAKDLLGGKGANLAKMSDLNLPVPPGFTLTTDVCNSYYQNDKTYPDTLKNQVATAITAIENNTNLVFGDDKNPLLVSVRSGARVSMPGMMDTVLNLGLNKITVAALAEKTSNPRFAYDCYRRFIQMYGSVVMDVDHYLFEDLLETYKRDDSISEDTDLNAENWQEIIAEYERLIIQETGKSFPQNVHDQLWGAISAVFDSWMNPRAITYRAINNISANWGTAVNVQAMVFGNMGDNCATGVAFTRNPSTGHKEFYGEFLMNAQGEDVVAGIRTPQPLTKEERLHQNLDALSMEESMPDIFKELDQIRSRLETYYQDMQDIEFTVQENKLYMLQTRTGKRTAKAALKMAVDMVHENLITKEQALLRIDANSLDQLLHPTLDPKAPKKVLTKGLPASPGAASGVLVFTADDAERLSQAGERVILARTETSPEDIHGMHAAHGILTSRGGMTSHAAVVARGMGRCCVAGASEVVIDHKAQQLSINGTLLNSGDIVTLDGSTGDVILGKVPTIMAEISDDFQTIMGWADKVRRMDIRANAETVEDAKTALEFGATGIGLCRTEHMFFEPSRILSVRKMILAQTREEREIAIAELEPEQVKDFTALFDTMRGLPVTVRLLDPPLHEFLPHGVEAIKKLADNLGLKEHDVQARITALKEENPMLGHRGCRLGISYPEIYDMQVRAIFNAANTIYKNDPLNAPALEIMVPLVSLSGELETIKKRIDDISRTIAPTLNYHVGTMIELPRAALCANQIAEHAEFFSFGTNDLTQTTFGLSRDDAGSFLPDYQRQGLIDSDPFVTLDKSGVGELIKIARFKARTVRPDIKTGICGEHGGDPESIDFCEQIGLSYVSCSPYRIPIARLAAAQSSLRHKKTAHASDVVETASLKVA